MARGRMISKTLGCGSKKFARLRSDHPEVGLFAQALYPLLVANSDDFGRQKADAFTVKHAVWSTAPEDEARFDLAMRAMVAAGLILRYDVGEETYLQIVDFDRHQQGIHKRTSSQFPNPPEIPGDSLRWIKSNPPEFPGDSLLTELNRTEQNRTEQNRTEPPAASVRADDGQDDPTTFEAGFERFWSRFPRQQGRDRAWEAWRSFAPGAELVEQILAGVERWRDTQTWKEALESGDPQYVPMPEKWLGRSAWTELTKTNGSRPLAAHGCRHTPACLDDAACTQRYLAKFRGSTDEASRSGPLVAEG